MSSIPRGTLYVIGMLCQVSFFSLYSPATNEIRYVETGNDCRHVQVFWPLGASCTLSNFPLETVSQSPGTVRIISEVVRSFGIIVDGNVVVRVFRFPLRPDFLGAAGIVLVGENEIKAGSGLAFVLQFDIEFFAGFCGLRQLHAQFVVAKIERGVLAVDPRARNCKLRAIEIQMRHAVAQGGQRVRDLADHFALIEIKVERNAHVLQMVIAARRVRPVRACHRAQQNGQTKNRGCQGHAVDAAFSRAISFRPRKEVCGAQNHPAIIPARAARNQGKLSFHCR